jgi:ABC-type phosphate transport system substrate-binding protein
MSALPRVLLLLGLALLPWWSANADLVVVVNAKSGVDKLSVDEVINIVMGRYRQLPSGIPAQPIDQPESQPERARFYRLLVNKDLPEINAYWARLIFSGKTRPPQQANSQAEVVNWLASQRGAIGYMERSQVDSRFQIVLDLGR